ncbi:MAG: radical SAM/Cys-rich protein [Candidatus Marinamargulisbacteria bacterium]|jgi:radical SAM/Cys-rich protein
MTVIEAIKKESDTATPLGFRSRLKAQGEFPLKSKTLEIFQMNVGKLCNLACQHCHVEAGPDRTELMTRETFEACLEAIKNPEIKIVDMTGGAPEMNSHLAWFIEAVSKLGKRLIVRSNLTVLLIPKYAVFIDLFVKYKVEVVASLPCYAEKNTDEQRGTNVFKKSIKVLQILNEKGYGKPNSGLVLNLVHNPNGAFLPPNQADLESSYKKKLFDDFGINFNLLFCITNMPIKRFMDYLVESKQYESYMATLVNAYNPAAVDGLMCKNTLSVAWDGQVYDCDFNQMLDLTVLPEKAKHISNFDPDSARDREIVIGDHCFGCTAGAGSSCQGEISE